MHASPLFWVYYFLFSLRSIEMLPLGRLCLGFWTREGAGPILNDRGWYARKPRSLTSSSFGLDLGRPAISVGFRLISLESWFQKRPRCSPFLATQRNDHSFPPKYLVIKVIKLSITAVTI
jgi:hypothetical protein